MKILKDSVRDVSSRFIGLEEALDDADYVVSIYSRSFEYIADAEAFCIANLRDIFSENAAEIIGNMNEVSWSIAYEKIRKHLRYATYLHGIERDITSSFKIVSENILQKRISIFEDIIKSQITIPPQEIIELTPARPSYFGNFLTWGLCFIFLREGKGIVIHFETSD